MSKKLVAYFSASGVTGKVAKDLAKAAGADLYEIKPAEPYSKEDLNWNNKESRSSLEMNSKVSRPHLADKDAGIEKYDVIFLSFPIWWYTAPRIINTLRSWKAMILPAGRSSCLQHQEAAVLERRKMT